MATTSILSMLTWTRYFYMRKLTPENPEILEHAISVNPTLNEKVSLWQGDITKVAADAIVNAANTSLLGGGGVDGAIHRAAGSGLVEECSKLNGCKVGEAKITKGYDLPAKHIIHTVGPMNQCPFDLARSYKNSLLLMIQHSLKSIVFPCISTGIYGFDPQNAAHIALLETRKFLEEHHDKVDRVVFCVHSDEDLRIYEELMQRYFPVVESPDANFCERDVENYLLQHPEKRDHFKTLMTPRKFTEVPLTALLSKV